MSATTWIVVAAFMLPGAAAAQSTTTCTQSLGVTTCNTAPRPGINWGLLNRQPDVAGAYQRGVEQARQRQLDQQEAEQRQYEALSRQNQDGAIAESDSRSKQAGALILDGKCAEARRLALVAGDLSLAERVSRICQTSDDK